MSSHGSGRISPAAALGKPMPTLLKCSRSQWTTLALLPQGIFCANRLARDRFD
jgi:hypothetical protein